VPLYDYRCNACDHQFELLVRTNDKPACPACGSENLERLLSMFAVSSEGTRDASLQKARKAGVKISKDKAIAEQERIERFEREHHH